MNRQESDCLLSLLEDPNASQRSLSQQCGHSLGIINRSLKNLKQEGLLNLHSQPTEEAARLVKERSPKNAIILAAGFCMRMVPINTETPKALLEVNGEPLIERLIRQLQEAGIRDITIVVGFMKESFDYLIDAYGVRLVVNREFASRNNLHSLRLVSEKIGNTYILPCDIWCRENPFRSRELYSWYMVSTALTEESDLRISRNQELLRSQSGSGNSMVGIAYITEPEAALVRQRLESFSKSRVYDKAFWEAVLYEKNQLCLPARVVSPEAVVEINTYEQLRDLDNTSNHLQSHVIQTIAKALQVQQREICDITVLKKGMTNRSFLFSCRGKKYIMRIPGEGTDQLIDRKQEASVYQIINPLGLCDTVVYMDPENGYKITEFLPEARTCDSQNWEDVRRCMEKLRSFHELGLKAEHTFDIWNQILFYESLRRGHRSSYRDYERTKAQVFSLRPFIESHGQERVLTHIDAVPDNFLFTQNGEEIRLIDWEYAGMQDPHVDIAMFCIYSGYRRDQVDRLIDLYFPEGCQDMVRTKIYCYISACGLLWSNWCEYKHLLGVEFGEYSLLQYRYAKEYYKIAWERIGEAAMNEGN